MVIYLDKYSDTFPHLLHAVTQCLSRFLDILHQKDQVKQINPFLLKPCIIRNCRSSDPFRLERSTAIDINSTLHDHSLAGAGDTITTNLTINKQTPKHNSLTVLDEKHQSNAVLLSDEIDT